MRILQINSDFEYGSTGRIASELHAILLLKGYKSTVAYGRKRNIDVSCSDVIRIGSAFDNYLHVAKTRVFDAHGFASLSPTKKFINKIEDMQPDLIHLHNLHGYYIHISLLFKYLKKIKKPVVWTLHDCWAFTGHCSHYDYIGCDKWKIKCQQCLLKSEYPSSFLFDRSKKNYKQKKEIFSSLDNLTLVTPSIWLKNQVKLSFLRNYPVKVINNGIDLEIFRPRYSDIKVRLSIEHKFIILGVASIWSERKGLQYFIELAKRLNQDEHIILVGLNDQQIKKMPEGVTGIKRTNSTIELSEIYSAADVFLNPTLEDNYPTTNLEAIACGTPVITFNSGGSSESIKNGSGLIVNREDYKELVDAIAKIKLKGKNKYAQHCLLHAASNFNKKVLFEEYIDLYKKVQ